MFVETITAPRAEWQRWTERLRMPPPLLGDLALWLYRPVLRLTFRWSMRNLARLAQQG